MLALNRLNQLNRLGRTRGRGAAAPTIITDGLVAEWRFDDGSGQVLTDYSGNGHHGQLGSTSGADTNDPTWTAEGLQGDGVDDIVDIGHPAIFDLTTLHVFLVAKPTSAAGQHYMILVRNDSSGDAVAWMIWRPDLDPKRLQIRHSDDTGSSILEINQDITNEWHLIEQYRDTSEHGIRIDGGGLVTGAVSGFATGVNVAALFARPGDMAASFKGSQAFGALYNRRLTDEEATQVRDYIKTQIASRGITLP